MTSGARMIPVYVVHAKSLADRAASIEGQLRRAKFAFEWVTSFDPREITPEIETQTFAPNRLSPQQKSCALKHVEVFRRIAGRQQDRALVLEDDVLLGQDFAERLESVLGGIGGRDDSYFASIGAGHGMYTNWRKLRPGQEIYEATEVRTTDAYIVSRRAAEVYLGWIAAKLLRQPIDHALNTMNAATGVVVWWVEPPLARQGSLTGRFPSAIAARPHSRLRRYLQFSLTTFRRRHLKRWLRLS
jgi:glycosyl transferase family 25